MPSQLLEDVPEEMRLPAARAAPREALARDVTIGQGSLHTDVHRDSPHADSVAAANIARNRRSCINSSAIHRELLLRSGLVGVALAFLGLVWFALRTETGVGGMLRDVAMHKLY